MASGVEDDVALLRSGSGKQNRITFSEIYVEC
jgi:hypothetical protein